VWLTLDFDSARRIAIVQGKTLKLSENDVVFVDDVDTPTGPRVTATLRVERVMSGSAGQIGMVLRKSPEIMSFLRCEASVPDGYGRAYLEKLCLQNIGITK
jgi:hypothetical protein